MLSDREIRDIKLWFGWGRVLNYPTKPKDYLKHALKHKAEFLAMLRAKRKEILKFIIEENLKITVDLRFEPYRKNVSDEGNGK